MTTTVLNTKISDVENKIFDNAKYIITQEFNKLTAEGTDYVLNWKSKRVYNSKRKSLLY